jgi:hypothetical protein
MSLKQLETKKLKIQTQKEFSFIMDTASAGILLIIGIDCWVLVLLTGIGFSLGIIIFGCFILNL